MSEPGTVGNPLPIEHYALIGDCRTAALVGRNGSIDWLCLPHFDSDACFAALLGRPEHGHWLVAPVAADVAVARRYRRDTMVLDTRFATADGAVTLLDAMAPDRPGTVVRRVRGLRGRVAMRMRFAPRFEYGLSTPRMAVLDDGTVEAVAGRDRLQLRASVPLLVEGGAVEAGFTVGAGEAASFVLSWSRSHREAPPACDAEAVLAAAESFWADWAGRCAYRGAFREPVMRSLLVLKALSFAPTGAIVAAPTTSLPERIGGSRNWDYRYCWLRDATLSLLALMACGYREEARAWSGWLRRAVAGRPEEIQIMYGLFGERRLTEWSPDWLPGYAGSAPVNVGNAAAGQVQLDTYGEVMGVLHLARRHELGRAAEGWPNQVALVNRLGRLWREEDEGIWEVRGGRRHFTHSKAMAWLAVDSAIRDAEREGFEAPLAEWRALRDEIHRAVCERGLDATRNCFTRSFGEAAMDASLLLLPLIGFLPPDDPRMLATVREVEKELLVDGLVLRYRTEGDEQGGDGLPPGEGAFLPCSFWLARVWFLQGREDEARALFARLLELRSDLGLLAEEYDAGARRQLGNFPQAYSHLALIGTALTLDGVRLR